MNKRYARGFTLIELIIFIVVISVGLAGIMVVINTVVASSADPLIRKQSVSIAQSGLPVPGLSSYNFLPPVRVTATADLPGVAAYRVTVSVTGPLGVVSLSGYRGSY